MRVSVDGKLVRVTAAEIGLGSSIAGQDGALVLPSPDEPDVKQVSDAGGWAVAGEAE